MHPVKKMFGDSSGECSVFFAMLQMFLRAAFGARSAASMTIRMRRDLWAPLPLSVLVESLLSELQCGKLPVSKDRLQVLRF